MKSSRFNVQGSRFKERLKTAGGILLVVVCLCAFWIFLFQGIIAEQDRRFGQKSSRKWMQERALNQWQTEQNRPELMKAMHRVAKEGSK